MILLIIILTLFFSSSPIRAQEYIPYQGNPVVQNESTHLGAVQPYILKEGNLFSLWYADSTTSGYKIMHMSSSNGIDWFDKKNTNITNRQNASDPFVLLENGIYTLYFASSNNGPISIWKSQSADGATFVPGQEEEILKSQLPWEGTYLSCPALIKENNLYYLFYAGSGVPNWGIGLATSTDGKTWQKCPNNPFIAPGASAQVIKYNNIFSLYFQSPNGLEVQQTNNLDGCNTLWTNRHIINSPLRDPAPLQVGDDVWLYGSFPTETGVHIGIISANSIPLPTYPVVIIPGMFASWNKDAILHNMEVPFDAWTVQPAVSEYDALSKTLENKGYVKDNDYFIFAYDWRKPVEQTIQNLNTYLMNKVWSNKPYQPVQLVGHSLGGVVARAFADKNPPKPIKQIITAGSPHLGIVQAYKPLAGGEIERENSLMWLAEKLILLLNKSTLQSDKDTISQKIPVLFDLLPTFSFLKNESGSQISSTLTNKLVETYPIKTHPLVSQFYLGGSGKETPSSFIVGARTTIDTLFGTYLDGHPLSSLSEDGDGVVLEKSSLNQISPALIKNHGEIIYSKESVKEILSHLQIPVQDTDIPPGKATMIFPAILTFIQSPAKMQITYKGKVTNEIDGMIYLENAENGNYSLQVVGDSNGEYKMSMWLIGANSDKWFQFSKSTSSGKRDEYTISFDNLTGGTASEYVVPTPLPSNTPIPTPRPTIKPTLKPEPTKKPCPTKIPTPTEKPHKNNEGDKRRKNYVPLMQLLLNKLIQLFNKKHY